MLSSISPLSPSSGITIRSHENMRREDRKIETKRKYEEEKMKKIDLSGLSLDSLTNPSINLAVISHLDLSNNNLESIPESLTARLLNLAILDLRSNQLKHLPNSMGCLSKLRILNISGNLIESLPKTIEDCRSLEELNANFNKLIHLPDTIGFELINLKKLSVNSNKLVSLPYSTSHMTSLRVLDARLNCLRSLPEDMENLTNLQILNVSQNFHYLTELPYSIGLLVSLVELDISYNKISTLPPSIGCLRNLEKLCVDGNPLLSPPLEVFEHSLSAVKEYLCDQMNGTMKNVHKKRSWISKIVKHGTFNGFMSHNLREREDRGKFSISEYRSINGIATPKHIGLGMFSPRRLFSPRRYCTTNT